jgi:hypothetical protein
MKRSKIIAFCAFAAVVGALAVNLRAVIDAAVAVREHITVVANNPPFTPAPGSPFRLDSEPIPFKIGDRYFLIPANVLDSPPGGGREGRFYVDQGSLLVFSWPTMEGRTKQNWKEMGPPEWRRVQVLVYRLKKGRDNSTRLLEKFRHHLRSPRTALDCANPLDERQCPELYEGADDFIRRLPDIGGLKHFERYDHGVGNSDLMSDIYLEIDGRALASFYSCNRATKARQGKGCTVYFIHDGYIYDVTFNFERITMPEWPALRAAVIRRMVRFEQDGAAFRKTIDASQAAPSN